MEAYVLKVGSSGTPMELSIGDYTVYSDESCSHSFAGVINPWITSTDSHLLIELEMEEIIDPSTIAIEVNLELRKINGVASVVKFQGNLVDLEESLPTVTIRKEPNHWHISFSWPVDPSFVLEAPWSMDSSATVEDSVLKCFMEIYEAFINRDVNRLMELGGEKVKFTSVATRQDVNQLAERTRRMLEDLFSESSVLWTGIKDPKRQIEVVWIKNNSVCRIRDADNLPPLRTETDPDEDFFEGIDVVLGFCGGKWIWIY